MAENRRMQLMRELAKRAEAGDENARQFLEQNLSQMRQQAEQNVGQSLGQALPAPPPATTATTRAAVGRGDADLRAELR